MKCVPEENVISFCLFGGFAYGELILGDEISLGQ